MYNTEADKKVLVFGKEGYKEENRIKDKNKIKNSQFAKNIWILGSGIGFEVALPIVFGGIIGKAIDSSLSTAPRFTLSLLFLGVFIGFYNLYRIAKSIR